MLKGIKAARETVDSAAARVVAAAGDTKRSIAIAGGIALAALVVGIIGLVLAARSFAVIRASL